MPHRPDTSRTREWHTIRMISAGSLAEGIVGAASGTIAIAGLFGFYPVVMLSASAIGAGAALLLQGGSVAGRLTALLEDAEENRMESSELGGGMVAEFLGGSTGVVLGVLSLLGVAPGVLLPTAVIVLGITLLFSTGISARMNSLVIHRSQESDYLREVGRQYVAAAAGAQFLIAIGALVLGIAALSGVSPITLSLTAMLCLGVSDLVSGTAIAARLMRPFRG
ncbi:MAG TPA: hypothetical protein PKW48_12460 [Deltaproteobacteria bacterium]|nr:hypothetical protein [Deltaproteobacteria bacterium]HRR22479.1 hypothetical protein [Desulfomonilia bacterium]HRR70403.1 hypothetical protein [Desulfomonilia bacterium]HRT45654.1 hypothetical protein [Desulfomonilia bacterium]